MNISINNLTVETETGPVVCNSAEVSVAVSNSVAIRLVPVDASGTEYPTAALGIVGGPSVSDIAEFMASVQAAVTALAQSRGL